MEVRDTTKKDLEYIKNNIRQDDINELIASHEDISKALDGCIQSDMCLTFVNKNKPLFIFGVNADSIISKKACVFLIGTKDIEKYPIIFYKFTKEAINETLKDYEVLYNFVDSRYKKSIKWLKKIGAKFKNEVYFNNVKFFYFEFRR